MPEDIPVSDLPALDLDESDDELALDLDESDDEAPTPSPTPLNRPPVYETPAPTPLTPPAGIGESGAPTPFVERSHVPIDDKTASNYLRELNGMYPGENDLRAEQISRELDLYAATEPERRKRDERQYLRDIFTDDEAMKEFADTDEMRQREKFSVDPNLERYRAANWMQLEHELGRPIKDDLDYETQRNAVSRERNGKPATSDTDFYQARRKEYQLDKTLELARTELIGKGITKAVADQALGQPTEVTSVIDEVVSHYPDAFPTDAARDQAAVVLRDSTAMVRDVTEKLRPDLAAALPVIQKMVSKTATDEDAMTLYRLFGSKITEGNRKDVGAIIGLAEMVLNSQGQELDRSLVMTELENAKKAFFRDGFAWIPQGNITQQEDQVELARMAISDGSARIGENGRLIFSPLGEGLPGAPTRGRPLTNEEKAFHDERLSAAMDVMQAQRIVNDALAKKLDPIEYLGREGTFWGTTERMALDAIQSAPYMGSAVAAGILGSLAGGPIGGTAASMAMMHYMDAQTQLQDLTINNPELPRETRKSYANWSAAAQLPFNYLEVELFLGRFPVLAGIFRDLKAGNLFGAIAKGGGDLAARQFLEFGAESVQNGISDLTAIIAENAKSSLSANMHQVWDQAVENGPRTFFALLPYTLIGTGMASLNDYGVHAKELLAVDGLEAAGFSPAQINSILAGRTTEERTAILQRETPLRVPETVRAAAAKFAQELDMANGAAGAMQQIAGMPSWASIKKADGTIEYTVKDTAGNVVTTTGSLQQAKLSFTEQAEKAMTEYLLQGQTQQAKEEEARATAEAGAELEILDVEGRAVAETSPAATIAFEAPVAGAAPDAGLARLNTKIQREDPSLNIREVIPSASQVSPVGKAVMDAVRALQGFTGRQVRFIEDVNGNELFFRGVVDPDDPNTIWIDARGTRSTLAIFGHEFTHTLEKTNPQLYQEFVTAITPYIGDLEVEHAKIAKRHGGKYTAPQLSKEYIANVAGDAFAHPELLNRLAKSNPGLFTKVVNALKQWFQQFKEYASTFGTETSVNVEKVQDQLVALLEKVKAAPPYVAPTEPAAETELEYARGERAYEIREFQGKFYVMFWAVNPQTGKPWRRINYLGGAPNAAFNTREEAQAAIDADRGERPQYARVTTAEETKYAMQIERGVREVAAIGHYSDEEKAKVGEWVRTQLDAMPNVPKHGAKRSAIEAEMLAQVEADIREKRRENPDRVEPRTESDTGVTLPWAHVDISGVTTIFVPQSATQKKERVKAVAKWKSIPFSFEKVPKVGEHGLPWQTGKYEGEQTVAPAVLNLATGKVGQGRHHAEAYGDAGIELANLEEDTPLSQGTRVPNIQGFVTDKGRFTDEVGNYLVLTPEGMVASPMDAYTQHLATKMVDEFFARLAKGGHNAQVILDQIGWYENVIEKLRIEYGGFSDMFADFLGGFSPATGVVENWKNAVGFLEAVSNGKYDTLFQELHEWVAAGKTIKQWRDAKKPIPLKENDVTLFGSNTNNGLAAVLEMWREVKFGDPPKARNFTKNLIGKSLHATIDRWAARMLQRLAGHERIPIGMAETGVTGKHTTPEKFAKAMGLPDVSGQELPPTGQFGVGQIVFAKATEMMRQRDPARFKDLIPSSMQAMNWFVEKEFWAEMNWSSKEGEGGSFEEMLKKQNAQRFIVGLAQTREGFPGKVDFIPNTLQNVKFGEKLRKRLVDKIKKKGQFLAVRSKDSLGMFEQKPERSLDTELLTGVNIEPLDIVRIAAEEAGAAYQKSTFVARAIKNAEVDNPNARPGIEVYFDHQVSMAEVQPVMDYLVSRGIDGFTAIVDARSKPNPDPEAGGPDQVWGVRMMWIPEYAVEGHDLADDWVAEGTKVHHILEDGVDQLEGMQGVAHAVVMQYDTVVLKTGLDYDERGIIETSPGRAIADAWRERFFRATTPQTVAQPGILQEGREPGAGDVPDRGEGRGPPEEPGADAVAESGEEDQFLNYARKPDYRPKKTVKAYKLFRQGKDGNLYPLFIDKNTPVPVGTWMVAKFVPTKGFAKRPGWHAGTLPYAGHLRSKKTGQKAVDRVWAEAEMPADKDWQPIADQQPRKDIRDQIPANGFYRFKTSKMQGGAWMIGGAVKVNRVLSNEEVAVILRQAGEQAQIEAETNGALSFARREGKFAQAKAEGPLDRGASIEAIFEQIHGAPTRKAETTARAYRAYQAVAARHEAEIEGYQPPEVPDLDLAIAELEGQEILSQENLALEEQAEIDASIQAASDEFDGPIADARDEVTRKALEREKRLYVSRKRKGIEAVYAERSKALATQFALQRQNTRTTVEQAQTAATAEGSAELKRMRRVQTFAELNAILRAIPMAMRGRAGIGMTPSLEGLSDVELTDFLTQRLQAIGRELERSIKADFVAAIEDVLDKAKPKKTKGGVLKGTLADAQRVVDEIKKIKDLNGDQVALEIAGIEGQLTAPLEPEQEERLHERHHLHLLFGDLSNRTAAELESALAVLQTIVQQGRTQWYLLEQQRLAKQRDQSAQLLEALGTASPEQIGKMQREEGFGMIAGGFINSHYSFFQFLQQQLPNLPFVTEWAERARRANAASEDFARKSSDRFTNVIKTAIGSNSALKTGAAVQKLQQPTVAGRTGEAAMTQLDAIQYLLSWDQADIRARMEYHGWDEAAIQRLRDATNDPVSTAVKAFLAQEYAASWQVLNPVYRAMYGVDMPRIPNYAPSRYHHAGNESQVDNMFGGPTATSGTTPGFVHARINHKAQLRQMDAMHVYMQHMSQVGSWTNFAELIRELRGTMNDANVKMAMEKSLGSANYRSLNLWIDSMQRNGANKAAETLALDKMLGYMTKVKAVSTMAFSVKTSIMQTDSAFRFMAEIPLRAWWRTFLDPAFFSSIPKAWHSDTVQRRVQEGMSPDMQYLMQQGKLTPTGLLRFFRAGFIHIRYVAGAFDAFSSAAVFKYHLDEQTKAGVPAAEAEAYALDKMDAAMQRFSQPTMMTGKGLIGVNGSPLFKMIAMFTSDPMLKTSIMAHAAMQIRRGQDVGMNIQRIGSVFVWALISHVIASVYRDLFTDDEDEEIWSMQGFLQALALAPLSGWFMVGPALESLVGKLTGVYVHPKNSDVLWETVNRGERAVKNYEDALNFDDYPAMIKEWDNIIKTLAAVHPLATAAAGMANIAKPIAGAIENVKEAE